MSIVARSTYQIAGSRKDGTARGGDSVVQSDSTAKMSAVIQPVWLATSSIVGAARSFQNSNSVLDLKGMERLRPRRSITLARLAQATSGSDASTGRRSSENTSICGSGGDSGSDCTWIR